VEEEGFWRLLAGALGEIALFVAVAVVVFFAAYGMRWMHDYWAL